MRQNMVNEVEFKFLKVVMTKTKEVGREIHEGGIRESKYYRKNYDLYLTIR